MSAPVPLMGWQAQLAVAFALALVPSILGAQLTVEQLEVVLVPGSVPVATFAVRNDGDRAVQAGVDFEDWDRDDNGRNQFYPAGTHHGSCGDLITAFPTAMRLEPGQSGTVRVSLVGADSLTEPCWSVVFVENREQPGTAERQITFSVRTGVKIYVEPPNLLRDGLIEDMSLQPHREISGPGDGVVDSTRQDVVVAFRNSGGLQARLKGSMEIRRLDNSLAHNFDVKDVPVLPGARRLLRMLIPPLPAGRYVILALLDYGGAEVAAGQLEYEVR